ncbi:hypothetical protein LSCM1_04080 [Leishmania martiniquensis]|uniref:RCC1-like domain-containing protein n=1 Tax=Leishmania martiniquensis TaxID=1580590 RepID=A0A836KS98_9TRYP|nr:hypothetical protein LSCM1_04080 [Leishmania martiniquensis]
MEAACRRWCQGDTSSLPDIVNCIEAGQQAPTGKLGARVYTALATLLLREGLVLRELCASSSALPSEEAFHALHILAILGSRLAEEGHTVKSVLLSLGLQRCRDMILDAYFALKRWQRYYVVMFVTLLISVYGCCPQDLLRNVASRSLLTGLTDSGQVSSGPEGAIESTELIRARSHSTVSVTAATAGCSDGLASLTGQANPQHHLGTRNSSTPLRPVSMPSGGPVLVSIPGASADIPLQPERWYRELPRKPINAPYPVNPLYVSFPLREGSGVTTAVGGKADSGGLGDAVSPISPSLVAGVPITAQFPAPVVLFSAYHGVGCVPRLPTTDDLSRLNGWRERKQWEQASKSSTAASSSAVPAAESWHEWRAIMETAQRIRALGAAADDGSHHPFALCNGVTFASLNRGTSAYQRQCLASSLLRQYMEHGNLLSWGSLAKGALGQHSQRRGRSTSGSQKSAASSGLAGPKAQVGAASRPSSSAAQQYQRAPGAAVLGSSVCQASLAGCDSPAAGLLMTIVKVPLAREPSATDALPARRPAERSMLHQLRTSPSSGLPKATSTAAAEALAVSAALPGGASTTGYVYLPLSVCTPARVAQIACGLAVTYVLTVEGVLYSCGRADKGQLGIGERGTHFSTAGVSKLQRVLLNDNERITRVAAGTACAVALTADGALHCWGHNVYGQCLKMPDTSRVFTPVRLEVGPYGVLDVCFGEFFGVLLFGDGAMGTWGIASMLGCKMSDKELETSLAPDQRKCVRQIVYLRHVTSCPIVAVRAGPWHALAISQKGEVYTWGVGRSGRLGHGTDTSEVKPRLVEGLQPYFVVDASCSYGHSAVLTSTGTVFSFGENTEGQLGLRGCAPRLLPTMVPLPVKAVAVTCAREHTCILLEDGDVVACGSYRTCGIGLGYGRRLCAPTRILTNYMTLTLHCGHLQSLAGVVHRHTTMIVVGPSIIEEISRVSSLTMRKGVRCAGSGSGFIVVLSESNSLVAIGRGECGQLGIGDSMRPNHSDDVTVASTFSEVHIPSDAVIQHVRCGPDFVLALDESGAVYGWGSNEHQKLCQPADIARVFSPVRIAAYANARIVQIGCGGTFVVALTADGEVLTHGEAIYCGLGTGASPASAKVRDVPVPTRVEGLHDIVAVAAGRRHAVAMTASCSVFAWGVGALGTGSTAAAVDAAFLTSITPAPVRVALSQTIRSIGCGPHNSFAISDEGELWVWGMNWFGECGTPTNGSSTISTSDSTLQNLATGPQQGGNVVADRACAIATPTSVAKRVRDAAFTSQFGVVVFEDGKVSVSGRIWYGGQSHLLPSFHSIPQPPFLVDAHEPVRCPSSELSCSVSASFSGDGGCGRGSASAAAAGALREYGRQGSAGTVAACADENEQPASNNVGLPATGKPAMVSTDGQHRRHPPKRSSPRPHVSGTSTIATPPASAHGRTLLPHRATLSSPSMTGGRSSPLGTPSHGVTTAGTPAPRCTPNDQLPSFAARRLASSDVMQLEYGQGMTCAYSSPSFPGLITSGQGSMQQTTTIATVGTIDAAGVDSVEGEAQSNLALTETCDDSDEGSATDTGTALSSAEVSSEVVAHTPMPPCRVSNGATAPPVQVRIWTATQDRKPLSATPGARDPLAPPLLSPSPDCSTPHCAGAGRVAARAHVHKQTAPPPQFAHCEPKVPAAAAVQPPHPSVPSPLQPPAVSDARICGIRCFAGWEQICIVTEKCRPSAAEVAMAQSGLHLLLHQEKNAAQGVRTSER